MNKIIKTALFIFFLIINDISILAQAPDKPGSNEIFQAIQKLNFLGSVLYIAAHPDDENTNLISYLSNDLKARTAYLSLTRGDGGQNLIGPEIRELLGVIRTQELLAARRTDGGEQLFTRANDFGYSKHPDETLAIWNKKEVLGDVVWAIRNFQPDIIINRFSHKKETFGKTHGHHTSSAVLSELAFDLSGDPSNYPEQLEFVSVWNAKSEYFNTSWWFYGSQEKFEKADKTNMLEIETGTYYSLMGLSNGEISSLSRSMHKSQGFGSTGSRGNNKEYLELVKGNFPKDKSNLFDGINTTWTRLKDGEKIGDIITKIENDFDFKNPAKSVDNLVKAYQLIQGLDDEHWKMQKSNEIKNIIQACTGLYLEAVAQDQSATRGSEVTIKTELINRSNFPMVLKKIDVVPLKISNSEHEILTNNQKIIIELKGLIPSHMEYTSAYWLRKKGTLGMYNVTDMKLVGKPESPKALTVTFFIDFNGATMPFNKDVVYKRNDPVKGEVYKPFEIVPIFTSSIADKVIIFADSKPKEIAVKVQAWKSDAKGIIQLEIPKGWQVFPKEYEINITDKGAEQTVHFTLTPPDYQSEGKVSPVISSDGNRFKNELIQISYDHIPFQSVLMPSESKIVRLDIEKKGELIGYIQGAGDAIPASLQQVGYTVIELNEKEITTDNLQKFDAVILGIRAYNTNDASKYYQKYLHEYVKKGGTLLVQYNTNFRLKVDEVSPLHLKLSRDRVTDENSEVIIIDSSHEVMQTPNKITSIDFEGWVQERGLYFPNEWDPAFSAPLSMQDKGESPKTGSLLIANYGKGYFIYTGLSFFRELPVGIPGAFRLYTNLLSIGKKNN